MSRNTTNDELRPEYDLRTLTPLPLARVLELRRRRLARRPTMSEKKLRPLGERVLVQRDGKQEISQGGIVLPSDAQKNPHQGTVVAVGDAVNCDSPLALAVGDRVLFTPYSGYELPGHEGLLVLDIKEVLAVEVTA
jgi:chaperonin GroES